MAADILAYHATRVPVGDDQRQHLELANDIAQKFNHDYGADFFPAIEPLILGPAARVMSLRDGMRKMSKSEASDQSRINLNDDADTIALKIRRAKTDPAPLPSEPAGLAERPEARNLVGIYAALAGTDAAGVLREHGGAGIRRVQGGARGAADREPGADRGRDDAAAGRPAGAGRDPARWGGAGGRACRSDRR